MFICRKILLQEFQCHPSIQLQTSSTFTRLYVSHEFLHRMALYTCASLIMTLSEMRSQGCAAHYHTINLL